MNGRGSSSLSRTIVALLIMALSLGGPFGPAAVQAQAAPGGYAEAAEAVDRFVDSMRSLREGLDPLEYDIDALSFDVAFDDADTIVRRVFDRIDYEPYRGALRGAAGTVASGAGNALDQSLVVARLLLDAGYEVQIRRAELSDDAARAVLSQVRAPESDVPTMAVDPGTALPGLTEEDLVAFRDEAQRVTAELRGEAAAAGASLLDVVQLAPSDDAALLDVARDYFWVGFRLSANDEWQDGHPVFGETAAAVAGLTPEDTFAADIPADLQHRVRVQAFIERKMGDALETVEITSAWERPTANLYGVPRTFSIAPDGIEGLDDPEDIEAVTEATRFFYPLNAGSPAAGAMAFDLFGNVVPPEAAASAMSGVFGEVNRGFNEAGGLLGALGTDEEPEAPQALTAVWLEFTLVEPGGDETSHRRMIVDRIGAEARAAGEASLPADASDVAAVGEMAGAHTYMLDTGVYSEEYVLDRSFGAFAATADYLHDVLAAMEAGERPPSFGGEAAAAEEALGPLHLYQAFEALPHEPGVRSFRPAPGLVVMSQRLDGLAQVDIVANPRLSLRVGPDGPTAAPEATLRAGAWETRAELLPLQGEVVSPSYRAVARGDLVVVRDEASLAGLDVPSESTLAMREDLERGYLIIAPRDGIGDESMAGWWRVDPVTGETLGRGGDGRGNAFIEYLTSFEVSLALTTGFTVYGVHECTKIEDATLAGCCIVQNVALAGAGSAVGAGAAIAFSTAENLANALIVFSYLDFAGNIAATYIPTFCPASS